MAKTYDQEVAEHYRRIRTDPYYRLCEQMADLEAGMEPAWCNREPQMQQQNDVPQQVQPNISARLKAIEESHAGIMKILADKRAAAKRVRDFRDGKPQGLHGGIEL